jgi:hypothetical protein
VAGGPQQKSPHEKKAGSPQQVVPEQPFAGGLQVAPPQLVTNSAQTQLKQLLEAHSPHETGCPHVVNPGPHSRSPQSVPDGVQTQEPDWQVAPKLFGTPVSHGVPSAFSGFVQPPVCGSQTPTS